MDQTRVIATGMGYQQTFLQPLESLRNRVEAEPVFERALMIDGTNPQVLAGLNQLARSTQAEGRSEEAEDIYEWALEVSEDVLGPENANTSFLRTQYAQYLRLHGRHDEADRLG